MKKKKSGAENRKFKSKDYMMKRKPQGSNAKVFYKTWNC